MALQYINIRIILDKILRHPLLLDINLETAVDYTVDFMRIVGVPDIFIDKTEVLKVLDYRAQLPNDYLEMILVRDSGGNTFRYTTDSFHLSPNKKSPSRDIVCSIQALGSLINKFPDSYSLKVIDSTDVTDLTYKVLNNVIFTSIKEGDIEISYRAILVDEEGFPLIPDNSSFTRALEWYIKVQFFTILFDMGKISLASLLNAQLQYAWAVGDCATEFNRLSLDKAESFYNSWRTLLIRDHEHSFGFRNNGAKE